MVKEFIQFIVKSIVHDADAIEVYESVDNGTLYFKIKVKQEDKGRLIGREGRTIRSIRSLVYNMCERNGQACVVDLTD